MISIFIELLLVIAVTVITVYHLVIKKPNNNHPPLPPGPQGLPLLGNILSLEPNLHSCLANMAKPYGPIMKIKLGTTLCVIINSASTAREVYKENDIIFANRHLTAVTSAGSWGSADIVWVPHGENWRMLRKICVHDLLSNTRLDALYGLRRAEVQNMVKHIFSTGSKSVNISDYIFNTMFNLMAKIMWGGTPEEEHIKNFTSEFREALEKVMPLVLAPNVSDLFPSLAMFDLQGLARRMKKISRSMETKFESIINQRSQMANQEEIKDFLQVLLKLKNDGDHKVPFTATHIKALLMNLLGGGTKSTSTAIEWAMAELLRQPNLMKNVQDELQNVVGNNRMEESHCSKLHYLNAVVKETLRLHPITPLLFPKFPSESCVIGGYMIPKGTKVLVNAWAIQRDPAYWNNPLEYQPERFLVSEENQNLEWGNNGNNHNYLPFGSGRRVCVGIPMAERMIPYLLGSLLHSFEWKLPKGVEIDFSETFGFELRKTIPLVAIPSPRLSNRNLYA